MIRLNPLILIVNPGFINMNFLALSLFRARSEFDDFLFTIYGVITICKSNHLVIKSKPNNQIQSKTFIISIFKSVLNYVSLENRLLSTPNSINQIYECWYQTSMWKTTQHPMVIAVLTWNNQTTCTNNYPTD